MRAGQAVSGRFFARGPAGGARSKYGNAPTPRIERRGGQHYRSRLEQAYAGRLRLEQLAGRVLSWEREVRFDLRVNGVLVTFYRADFVVKYVDGRSLVIDTKGYADSRNLHRWPLVQKLMLACHGVRVWEARKDASGGWSLSLPRLTGLPKEPKGKKT